MHLYGAARECRLDEFHEHALDLTRRILHFDSAAVIKAAPKASGDVAILSMHNYRQPIEKLHDRTQLTGPDPTLSKALRQPGRCLSDELHLLDRKKHGDIIRYARKYDVAYSLVLVAPADEARGIDLISLWRAPRSRHYGQAGDRLGDLVLPHLFMARQINEQMRLADAAAAGRTSALLITDVNGCLRFVDPHAITWLQKEWPQWSPPMLPPALLESAIRSGTGRWTGRTVCAQFTVHGSALYIRLRDKPTGTHLTPAERAVARMAARGASYKAIAAELGVSPATVRNHLHQVYAKLAVPGKAALAHRLGRLLDADDPFQA